MSYEITKKYLNVPELSTYLNVPVKTIRDWMLKGKIPYSKLEGLVRFDRNKIERWEKEKEMACFRNQYN